MFFAFLFRYVLHGIVHIVKAVLQIIQILISSLKERITFYRFSD